jgi:hypothetical protein
MSAFRDQLSEQTFYAPENFSAQPNSNLVVNRYSDTLEDLQDDSDEASLPKERSRSGREASFGHLRIGHRGFVHVGHLSIQA